MTLDQNLHAAANSFPAPPVAPHPDRADDAQTAFEDRLWQAAEAVIASGASSISVVAETASLVRRQSELFASILSGAAHLKSLGADGGPACDQSLEQDLANTEERLISQLRRDLANL